MQRSELDRHLDGHRLTSGRKFRPALMALAGALTLGLALVPAARAATLNVPGTYADIATALGVAVPNDVILVAPGTYVVTGTINVTVSDVTIQGSGIGSTTLQVASAVGDMMLILGSGTTVRDFTIEKTDLPNQHLFAIQATNVTIRDNEIFGPDPITPWSVNGIVSRAMVVSGGSNGLDIQGNTIHHLRQPAYISGPTTGTITNNVVYGTRGWVIEGGALAFSGNSWSTGGNQGADIALLASVNPLDYPNLLALSSTNANAYISGQFVGASSGRAVAYVDDSAAPGGVGMSTNPYQTVVNGVAGALTGGVVDIAAGSYTEQVNVTRDMTLQGAGRALTTIVSPPVLAISFATPTVRKPVVLCQGAADIRVRDLTIDGASKGNANNSFQGIAWWNAGGKLLDCDVKNVQDNPFSGVQHGVAVYAGSNVGGPYALEVGGCNLTDFQKNGTSFSGSLTLDMHDCTVTGKGATGVTAQNGIQVAFGPSATITNCDVSDIYYTGPSVTATGQLWYATGTVDVVGGTVTDCQTGTYYIDTNGSMTGSNTTTTSGGGIGSWAVATYNSSLLALAADGLRPASSAVAARPIPQVLDADEGLGVQAPGAGVSASYTVTLDGGCLTGPGTPGTEGIDVYSEGGPLDVTATNLEISGWEWGIWVGGPGGASMDANHNAITGNTTGYEGAASATHLAEYNWWGHAGGPGVGGANPVVGGTVDFNPWLISGADTNPGCGFAPAGDNVVTPGPAPSCITPTSSCVTIPVMIARNTSENVRGFSVDIQLSANLSLCGLEITEGSYLNSIGGTNFQVLDNTGGSYTVDCAILGLPCGATAASGTLFNVRVASAIPSGTESITVTSVTLRDCNNGPVSAAPGAALSISVDNTLPAAATGLTATQDKTGNDGDGTTKIDLAFTPPGDADSVMIYRAGFGDYPEYDDGSGVVPLTPSYPPGGPWVKAATIDGSLSAYTDEVANRDFWYYVVFVKDACGNVSAVSNKTTGTLNYHLGDTHNGVTDCAGNNLVSTSDISHLGANYGVVGLAYADPRNCLDVGPTTDFSVNARPTTDNRIQFEDLIMFAINHGTVSAPGRIGGDGAGGTTAARREGVDRLAVDAVPGAADVVAAVSIEGTGNIQGLSIALAWNPAVVEPVDVEAGGLLGSQGRESLVLSAAPGNVDVALLGPGAGISGSGEVARVHFRVVGEGDPGIQVSSVTARDRFNRPVDVSTSGAPENGSPRPPLATFLGANYPNPFRGSTLIPLGQPAAGPVRLSVFDMQGRLVRTLVDGDLPAGERTVEWDGRDSGGTPVASGVYAIRLEATGQILTRTVKLVR